MQTDATCLNERSFTLAHGNGIGINIKPPNLSLERSARSRARSIHRYVSKNLRRLPIKDNPSSIPLSCRSDASNIKRKYQSLSKHFIANDSRKVINTSHNNRFEASGNNLGGCFESMRPAASPSTLA